MSLWTPGGEVQVTRRGEEPPARPPAGDGPTIDDAVLAEMGISPEELTPEQRAQAEAMIAEMAQAQQQIAATPAEQIVATHAAGLYELAAIKLQQNPPLFDDAKLAIDALAALVNAVGDQLGDDGASLQDATRNIQMAFVQIKQQASA